MKVLIIGKYPPIEGGVSSHTYWLARSLGEMGVKTAVVTNAGLVEETYRQDLTLFCPNSHSHDGQIHSEEYHPENVTVFSISEHAPSHIPYSEGYVTRLANLALKAIEMHGADIIYANYLEPYAMAGFLVKKMTGLPLVVRHAGSDIYRLLNNPEYSYVLGRVLKETDAILMSEQLRGLSSSLGIERKRHPIPSRALPKQFSPEGPKANVSSLWNDSMKNVPLITYLGKATGNKGLHEMLAALDALSVDFRMLFVSKGPLISKLKAQTEKSTRLRERVRFSDFVAPWVVPHILRSTDLLIHLENRFPVPIHSPGQPFEAIACETPLLLSGEMQKKIVHFFPKTRDLFSYVDDPLDLDQLSAALKEVLIKRNKLKKDAHLIRSEFMPHSDWNKHIQEHLSTFRLVQKWRVKLGEFWKQ